LGDPVSICYTFNIGWNIAACTSNGCSHFAGSGFHDVPSKTHHNHYLRSSFLATDILHRNVYDRATGLHGERLWFYVAKLANHLTPPPCQFFSNDSSVSHVSSTTI
jgi:hypothetical protein